MQEDALCREGEASNARHQGRCLLMEELPLEMLLAILAWVPPVMYPFLRTTCSWFRRNLPASEEQLLRDIPFYMAEHGFHEALRFILANGCTLSKDSVWRIAQMAATGGHAAVLRGLQDAGYAVSLPSLALFAARHDRDNVLGFLLRSGELSPDRICGICEEAARKGSVNCLRLAAEFLSSLDVLRPLTWIPRKAARRGHLGTLKLWEEWRRPWDTRVCVSAARGGHLECLKFLHECGCPWDRNTPRAATKRGAGNCLRYAIEAGCEWEPEECVYVLQGPLSLMTCFLDGVRTMEDLKEFWVVSKGVVECILFLVEKGCVLQPDASTVAFMTSPSMLRHLLDHGCPVYDTDLQRAKNIFPCFPWAKYDSQVV